MPVSSLSTEPLVLEDPELPEVGVDPFHVERLVTPAQDRYLVRMDPPQSKSAGGIELPDQALPTSRTGTVITVGPGLVSEDGHTRVAMTARVGQRILFEYAAGYSIPRVPDATSQRGGKWEHGYKIIRDGSIIAVIDGTGAWPEFQIPGEETEEKIVPRLRIVQDWLLVKNDRPQSEHTVALDSAKRPPKNRALRGRSVVAGGRMLLAVPTAGSQIGGSDTWMGTVVARGPGRLSIVRCLDGDRMSRSEPLCAVGDRILYCTEFPLMSLPGVNGYALVSERPCLEAVVG